MRTLVLLVIVFGIAIFTVYHFGGYGKLDPSQQGRNARAAISAGMTWQQVVKAVGRPRSYVLYIEAGKDQLTKELMIKEGPKMDFDPDVIASRVANKSAPHGFFFPYVFSNSVAFKVEFDETGAVIGVDDMVTLNKLLDMPSK